MQEKLDEAGARKIIEEAERKRREEDEAARAAKRDDDRRVVPPAHFHATVWTYREKDASENMKHATHHETLGLSVESCIRKARNRAMPTQDEFHLAMLSECTDATHGARAMDLEETGRRRN